MKGLLKRFRCCHVFAFMMCFMFLTPVLLFAAEDAKEIANRKAKLAEFFNNNVCADCHGASPKYPLAFARLGYERSAHKNNGDSHYANGGECQRCHTHQGFLEYGVKNTWKIDDHSVVEYPSQPGCFTCHNPHERGDFSLRTTEPVTLKTGKQFDGGKGNLCAHCHQSGQQVRDTVKPTSADKISPFWGAHHGPQADMLSGTNGYEYPGKTYFSSIHLGLTTNSCLDCHMAAPKARWRLSPNISGHSFNIGGKFHKREEKLNPSGCLGNCHSKMDYKKVVNDSTPVDNWFWWEQSELIFDVDAKADFDHDGKVEPLQAEIEGLLDLFVNLKGTGYLQKGELPMYKPDGDWNSTRSKKQRSVKEMAALYNYKFVAEDRSRGIHNASYTIQLLYDSIQSLDPTFDVSKRNVYKPGPP